MSSCADVACVGDKLLESDDTTDPRFKASAEDLKKKGIDDFQLYYAINTLKRIAGPVVPTTTIAKKGQ